METNDKEIKDKNSQPISIGLGFIFVNVIFFMIMTMFNIATVKYVCALFINGFVAMCLRMRTPYGSQR